MKGLSLVEETAKRIREDVLSGDFREGDRYLSENEVCQKFGVSRTTVREAMKILQAVGFLELRRGRGAFVACCDADRLHQGAVSGLFSQRESFLELSELRLGIEPAASEYAAERADEDEIFKLYGILSFFERACEAQDTLGMLEADEKFHNCIVACAHNGAYSRVYGQLSEAVRGCKGRLFAVRDNGFAAVSEHRAIADAIAEKNGKKARAAMEKHIENVLRNICHITEREEGI